MKYAVVLALAASLFYLIWKRLMHIDLSFIFFAALIALSIASFSEGFINLTAGLFGIAYSPLSVILIALFILLCLITLLVVFVTGLSQRHVKVVRCLAMLELARLEKGLDRPAGPVIPEESNMNR